MELSKLKAKRNSPSNSYKKWLNFIFHSEFGSAIFLLILSFPIIFLKLDSFHIRWWDESIYSINAKEMMENKNFFCPYFNNQPDHLNTKPPLFLWIQIVFISIFGFNELGIRISSAIAGFLIVVFLFNIVRKKYNLELALISILILICSDGFIGFHSIRTGDTDTIFSLFILVGFYFCLPYPNENNSSKWSFFWGIMFFMLAFAIKSFASLLFIPGIIIIYLFEKKIITIIKTRQFWIGLLIYSTGIIFILYSRAINDPEFSPKIIYSDALRLTKSIEEHYGSWSFYIDNLNKERFAQWFILFLIGNIFCLLNWKKDKFLRHIFIGVNTFLIIISISNTKLFWYDLPAYPLMSFITATIIYQIINCITQNKIKKYIIIFVVFSYPYWNSFRKSQANSIPFGERELECKEQFLYESVRKNFFLADTLFVYHKNWPGGIIFYKEQFKKENKELIIMNNPEFHNGNIVLFSKEDISNIDQKTKIQDTVYQKPVGETQIMVVRF